jgi:outer membrane lipoprotein SlyB
MKKIIGIALLSFPLLLTSCAPKLGGNDYSMPDIGTNSVSLRGQIASVRVVNLVAKQPNEVSLGAVGGGVVGAGVGNAISNGGIFTTLLGGMLGATAGHLTEQQLVNQEGFEYTVDLENGETKIIAQGAEPRMVVGQKVIVILNDKGVNGQAARSRVVPDLSGY